MSLDSSSVKKLVLGETEAASGSNVLEFVFDCLN